MKLNQKNKLLILGFILVLYVCYFFAFSKTISYYKEFNSNKALAKKSKNLQIEIMNLKVKEKQLDSLLSDNNLIKNESFQNELLKLINRNTSSYQLTLINFNEPHILIKGNKKTYSYLFTIKGRYSGLTKLINEIENNKSLGNLIHAKYYKIKDIKTNSDNLFLDVLIQKCE